MKKKSIFIKFAVILVCLLALSLPALAQKRRTSRKAPRAETTNVSTATNMLDVKSGAEKVSTQVKNVTKFIYVLGGVARVIEDLDKEIKAGKASRNANDLNAKNKQAVLQTIRGIRAGLAALEVEFRTKPALRSYLVNIQGISDMSGVAEDQALGGQFTEAGKTLLLVIEKLSDTLAAMP
jgi:hypothetical protein